MKRQPGCDVGVGDGTGGIWSRALTSIALGRPRELTYTEERSCLGIDHKLIRRVDKEDSRPQGFINSVPSGYNRGGKNSSNCMVLEAENARSYRRKLKTRRMWRVVSSI